jgi:CubicO group peptidase (beta-lactamase class C family)
LLISFSYSIFEKEFKMNRPYKYLLTLMLTILLISSFIPQTLVKADNIPLTPDLEAIDAFLIKQVQANRIPGLAVAIVQDDQIIFMKGYGEAKPGTPVTPQTQFYLGSMTKSFTALAAMELVQEGKLDLDKPVQYHLPWFSVADPEVSAQITVRNLLNHTSGLNEKNDPNSAVITQNLEEQACYLSQVKPDTKPGSTFSYYNQNYRLVGLILEQVSGQSYAEVLQSRILQPLQMKNTVTRPDLAPALAQGYSRVFGYPLPQDQEYNPGALPSGYLISTAEDMAHYLIAQLSNQKADGSALLLEDLLSTMRTPPAGVDSTYGMGWMAAEEGNTLAHGGSLYNFQSFMVLGLKEKTGMVLLFNQNSIQNMLLENADIQNGLMNLLNGTPAEPKSYRWVGWSLLALLLLDGLNHIRLFKGLSKWKKTLASKNTVWTWLKIGLGIVLPAFILFGLLPLMHALQGGSSTWKDPLHLMPDLTLWLLIGMSLDLIRNVIKVITLFREQ